MTSLLSQKPLIFAFATSLAFFPARVALADNAKAECGAAYEKGQEQRSDGKLKSAKETLAICARSVCPTFVKKECADWLEEVTNDLPSVVIDAKNALGEDVTAVTVTIDGEEFSQSLDGKAIELDPGEHDFHFEMEGAPPVDKREFLEKGNRDKALHVAFKSKKAEAIESSPVEAEGAEIQTSSGGNWMRPASFIAGGIGAAGLIGFAVLGASGKSKQSDMEGSCSPRCSQSDIDSLKSRYLLADISLGVGIVGLGTGVTLFILSQSSGKSEPQQDAKALKFDVKTTPSSAFATVSGRF